MSFSYDLASGDAETRRIAEVRLELGDTVENAGVLPDGGNLQDEEIAVLLDRAGDSVPGAVAAASGLLARRWAVAVDVAVGPRRESLSQAAARWQALAEGDRDAATGYSFSLAPFNPNGFGGAV